jgi:hypothetical protein
LNGWSPGSANIGSRSRGSGATAPAGTSCAAATRCRRARGTSSTVAPDSTERLRAVTSSVEAKRSLCLISSQVLGSLAMRTSANDPFSFSPRSVMLSLPFSRPARIAACARSRSWYQCCVRLPSGASSGVYTPQSHTITSPAPYCFAGITPSNEA